MPGRLLRALCVGLALLASAPALQAAEAAEATLSELTITQAQFATDPAGPWQTVALPDTWQARGVPRPGPGVYRLNVTLAETPTGPWALRVPRLSSRHAIRVNGTLVQVRQGRSDSGQPRPLPRLVPLPGPLLRAGENTVEIAIDGGPRGGLSPVYLGPQEAVDEAQQRLRRLEVDVPRALNLAAAGASLFAVMLWVRRRSEVALGCFGLLGLLASLRNVAYYDAGSALPGPLANLLFYLSQLAGAWLFGQFALALWPGRWPRWRRALTVGALLAMAAGAVATVAGPAALDRMRTLLYPLIFVAALPSLWLIGDRVRHFRGTELLALLTAMLGVVVAGVHDYFFQQGALDVMGQWWSPWAMPVALAAFGTLMMARVAHAMTEVEQLNRSLEQRVAERTQALSEANAAKSRFLAAASHDLRQPVAAVGLLADLLRERVAGSPAQALVAQLTQSVRSMEKLLGGLLDLSRLEAGTQRSQPQALALAPLLRGIVHDEAPAAQTRGLSVSLRCPAAAQASADPVLLQQVLRNLVGNAVRHTRRGGVLVSVRGAGPDHWRVQVWDTGPGIAEADQARIFQAFVQLESAEPGAPRRGLGLGLAIARSAAALMAAPLTLRSVAGRGSCFTLTLPRAPAASPARPDEPASAGVPAPVASAPLAGWTVLLLDDEPALRQALQLRLAGWGAQVQAYGRLADLARGLVGDTAQRATPRVLITDNRLPDGDACAAVACVREHFGAVPALVVTGDTGPQALAALQAAGLPVLHKPFEPDALRTALLALS